MDEETKGRLLWQLLGAVETFPYDVAITVVFRHFVIAVKSAGISRDTMLRYLGAELRDRNPPPWPWPHNRKPRNYHVDLLEEGVTLLFESEQVTTADAGDVLFEVVVRLFQVGDYDNRDLFEQLRELWPNVTVSRGSRLNG